MKPGPNPDFGMRDAEAIDRPAGCQGDALSTAEMLWKHLLNEAQGRTIQRVVAGHRFCAIMLDDAGVGLANTCPECGEKVRRAVDGIAPQQRSAWLPAV